MLPPDFDARFRAELEKIYASRATVLHEAMAYALCGPGKLLRPRLVLACALSSSAEPFEAVWRKVLPAMLAVEMVHSYSLAHDDLPAMDNDDFRRGRLSCHKKFGEAVAILVGDGLSADAIHILAKAECNALEQIQELTSAIGSDGMVLGQHEDILALSENVDENRYLHIHHLKTARLFECACVMGALSVGAPERHVLALREFSRSFGFAFQLKDDLKDNDATALFLGADRVLELHAESLKKARQISVELDSPALLSLLQQIEITRTDHV